MLSGRWLLVLGLLASCRESGPPARDAARVVALTASDFAFDAPDRVAAGLVTLRLNNRGREPHHAWLVRLNGDAAMEQFFQALRTEGPLPPAVRSVGGPGRAEPGFSADATIRLEPGAYLLLCVMRSADGTPHVRKGMMRHLEVMAR